jgi:hypothetical protein
VSYTREDKPDGSFVVTVKEGGKTDVYYFDKNAEYAKDPKGRDHNHVAFKDGKITMVRDDDGNKHNYDKDDKDDSDGGGGCYITTAILCVEGCSVYALLPLKEWRYNVLEATSYGKLLSQYYRQTASPIALVMNQHPRLGKALYHLIVKPSIHWAAKKKTMTKNIVLYFLFLIGLGIAQLLRPLSN